MRRSNSIDKRIFFLKFELQKGLLVETMNKEKGKNYCKKLNNISATNTQNQVLRILLMKLVICRCDYKKEFKIMIDFFCVFLLKKKLNIMLTNSTTCCKFMILTFHRNLLLHISYFTYII